LKLVSLVIRNAPPIKEFDAGGLSEVVVFAGPNGVGKTQLLTQLLAAFREPGSNQNVRVVVQTTSDSERTAWQGKDTLDSSVHAEAKLLRASLQRTHKRGQLRSGVLNFDATRALETIKPYAFAWGQFVDPWEEQVGWDQTFQPLKSRFQDTVHSLHRKIRSQKEEIATRALELKKSGATAMPLDFTDPLLKFKDAFERLLPGKKLVELDERSQNIQYVTEGTTLPLTSLSSGEREVMTVVFDFLLRDPQDCVIVFDEPELHLHPELSYRLLRTLREVGERNQFIFCTHSPDIISASIEQTVVFVTPPQDPLVNQALPVREDDEMARVLHLLGQSIGVISLGKKIVLIEGERSSLDKQTYGSIVGASYPELVLVPAGGRDTLSSFAKALETVLTRTIWGVEFFMLCDGDAAAISTARSEGDRKGGGRFRALPRYHLENYFLDESILARVFEKLHEPAESWLRSPESIRERLKEIARPLVSYAVALKVAQRLRVSVGNIDVMPSGCHKKELADLVRLFEESRGLEERRVRGVLAQEAVTQIIEDEFASLTAVFAREDDEWKRRVPGRPVLSSFAREAKFELSRLKTLYLQTVREDQAVVAGGSLAAPPAAQSRSASISIPLDPFHEIRAIFRDFANYGEPAGADLAPGSLP
jgi:energy-coupling factor transporter ATP-binding protein EcfA2